MLLHNCTYAPSSSCTMSIRLLPHSTHWHSVFLHVFFFFFFGSDFFLHFFFGVPKRAKRRDDEEGKINGTKTGWACSKTMRLSVAIFKWQCQGNIHFKPCMKKTFFSVKFNLVFQFDADVGFTRERIWTPTMGEKR